MPFVFQVYESVSVILVSDTKIVDLEWASNPVHDMREFQKVVLV